MSWCSENNLSLNTARTEEPIINFGRSQDNEYAPGHTHLRGPIWSTNTTALVKKAQQGLFFLRTLKKASLPQQMLVTFYHCTTRSILTYYISVWYLSCTAADRKALQWVVSSAQKIVGIQLHALEDSYSSCCLRKATSICKDSTQPCHCLFELLPSGRCYKAFYARTSRLRNSFYPRVINALNQSTKYPHNLSDCPHNCLAQLTSHTHTYCTMLPCKLYVTQGFTLIHSVLLSGYHVQYLYLQHSDSCCN